MTQDSVARSKAVRPTRARKSTDESDQSPRVNGSKETPSHKSNFSHTKRVVEAKVQSESLVTDRRERIIRAAITVFHRQGYHSTTTADIAREAGLTQSNIYNYVKSKKDVLFLVCDHLAHTYESILDEVGVKYSDPYTRIVEGLRAITDVMSTYRDEVQLLYNETHSLDKTDRVVILTSISRFISRFETLVEEYEQVHGSIRVGDRRLAANFLSFIPAMIALRYWDLVLHDSERAQDEIVRFALRGLGLPEPSQNK
jgi:AcrR family transcriptional regulator